MEHVCINDDNCYVKPFPVIDIQEKSLVYKNAVFDFLLSVQTIKTT